MITIFAHKWLILLGDEQHLLFLVSVANQSVPTMLSTVLVYLHVNVWVLFVFYINS